MRPGARLDAIVEILKMLLDQSLFPNFTNDEISEKSTRSFRLTKLSLRPLTYRIYN